MFTTDGNIVFYQTNFYKNELEMYAKSSVWSSGTSGGEEMPNPESGWKLYIGINPYRCDETWELIRGICKISTFIYARHIFNN